MKSSTQRAFDRLDVAAGGAMMLLVLLIAFTVLSGDHAGIVLLERTPTESPAVTEAIRVVFSAPLEEASLTERFTITPATEGTLHLNGAVLTFTPRRAWQAGIPYTVRIGMGVRALNGRALVREEQWSFTPRSPRLVYLAPAVAADADALNALWLIDPTANDSPRRLAVGVNEFRPSPDGSRIVFVRAGAGGVSDLYELSMATGAVRQVTNCAAVSAACGAPSWHPDGGRLAYERRELSAAVPETDRRFPRAWAVNLRDLATAPLLDNPLFLGGTPLWSPDGTRLAVFDLSQSGIVIYEVKTGTAQTIPTLESESGLYAFDPSGRYFIYPTLKMFGGRFTTQLEWIDLTDRAAGIKTFSGENTPPIEDHQPAWHPDGQRFAFTRRYMDGSGAMTAQLYMMNPSTGEVVPLVVDARYIHGAEQWSPTGDQIVFQRFDPNDSAAVPEVWLYTLEGGEPRRIVRGGFFPMWLP
ncbi:MAG TPA: Ig-like domain-containing protein [Aggregatilineales bacterium]|nr:PD40 domain-containing protein [Anaerolineales bacterium]HRE46264.1 Ig-like domain-containing protein [Aggregatilineales bacterium]